MASVSFKNVSVRFGKTQALSGVSLQVEAGEVMVLLGPSGCGKTTLLRALSGLQPIDEGTIASDKGVLSDSETDVAPNARGVGMVFQELALWPHMTALQHLLFSRGESARDSDAVARASELLREVGLEKMLDRLPSQLSGGEQQRLALARALADEPAVLLLDEPLSSLDPVVAAEIRRLLREVNRARETTMIYVTHSQEEAFELGDKVALMRAGRVLQVGSPQDLALRPISGFVAEFVGGGTVLDCSAGADDDWRCALGSFEPQIQVKGADRVVVRESELEVALGGSGRVVESLFRGTHFTTIVEIEGMTIPVRDDCRRLIKEEVSVRILGRPWLLSPKGDVQ